MNQLLVWILPVVFSLSLEVGGCGFMSSLAGEEYHQLEDRIEREMEEWNSQMTSSRNPQCWEVVVLNCIDVQEATMRLESSCDKEDRETRMTFAWSVMNCVLEDAGRKKYVCKARSVRTCTSLLPDSILPIYTQFLSHADTICFYQRFHVSSFL